MIQETRRGGAIIPVKEPIILSDPFQGPVSFSPAEFNHFIRSLFKPFYTRASCSFNTGERYIYGSSILSPLRQLLSFPTTNGHTRRQDGKKHLFRLIALCPPDTFERETCTNARPNRSSSFSNRSSSPLSFTKTKTV